MELDREKALHEHLLQRLDRSASSVDDTTLDFDPVPAADFSLFSIKLIKSI